MSEDRPPQRGPAGADPPALDALLAAARTEVAPGDLTERVLDHVEYRRRLERRVARAPRSRNRALVVATLSVVAAAAGVVVFQRPAPEPRPITISAEEPPPRASTSTEPRDGAATAAPTLPPVVPAPAPVADPCRERGVALGNEPLIDDFEDGDDATAALEQRVGYWRWAREIDAPGTAPALLPVSRPGGGTRNRLALHAKGGLLVDWGAALEFTFRPACYDASKYAGITFQARGPGRIYLAARETSVIPLAEGGTCERDCHNPHVAKFDLGKDWQSYEVRWETLRQRGAGKPPLDPRRLNSVAFLIRPEDTPYDVWIDNVRFVPR